MNFFSALSIFGGVLLATSAWAADTSLTRSPSPFASPVPPRSAPAKRSVPQWLKVSVGEGFVGQASALLGGGEGRVIATKWLDVKIQILTEVPYWKSVGLQAGVQQSEELLKNFICVNTNDLVGEHYCRQAREEFPGGAHFSAIYFGTQAELVELLTQRRHPLRFYVGMGGTQVRSALLPSSIRPYFAIQGDYQLEDNWRAQAGFFMSVVEEMNKLSFAIPALTFEHKF